MIKPSVLHPSECFLAEGPYWHEKQQCYFWVDIENGTLFQHHPESKTTKTWSFPHRLTLVLEGQQDKLILALDARIARFDPDSGNLEWVKDVESDLPANRCNDGACDVMGRLWIGTMSTEMEEGAGALYCLESDLSIAKKIDEVTISNGIAWSLDHSLMYYIDSPTHQIQAFHFDKESGNIEFDKIAVKIPEDMGTPDGMCTDRQGNLWVALYGGSAVCCWNPENGELKGKIELPVPNVTSCAFGGKEMDQLLITTARENLSEDELKKYPDSGSVFVAQMEVQGAPVYPCAF